MTAASALPGASRSDLDALRTPKNESGYRGVYFKRKSHDGVPVWVAKAKAGGRLLHLAGSAGPDPRACAAHVVAWYRSAFGDRWRDALAARKRKRWRCWRSDKYGGWLACVWLWGARTEVPAYRVRRGRAVLGDGPAVFASAAEAAAGVRRFVRDTLGLLSLVAVWRVGPADGGGPQVPRGRGIMAA